MGEDSASLGTFTTGSSRPCTPSASTWKAWPTASRMRDATVKDEIQSIMRSVDGAIKDVRKYIMRLKEPTQEASLDEQLHLFVRELQREARIPVRIKTEPVEGGLISAEAMMDILLIVREAVSNAVRHARASEIRITLVRDERGINLSIVDDGIGFDPDGPGPRAQASIWASTTCAAGPTLWAGTFPSIRSRGTGPKSSCEFPVTSRGISPHVPNVNFGVFRKGLHHRRGCDFTAACHLCPQRPRPGWRSRRRANRRHQGGAGSPL